MNKKILVINAGSSSIKFQVFEILNQKPEFAIVARGLVERIGIEGSNIIIEIIKDHKSIKYEIQENVKDHDFGAKLVINKLQELKIINDFSEIIGVGHRLVHGGEKFKVSTIINQQVIKEIEACINLAPLHNPAALKGYFAFKNLIPNVKHVGVFDTSFHMSLLKEKYLYSVPYQWYQAYQVRKYGFHGISYRYILTKLIAITKKDQTKINAIVCHLGNGASICAIKAGISYNTTMGLTPLDGLIMGTRSGIIDPSIHEYMFKITKNTKDVKTIEVITNDLNKASGLLGISEISSDLRDIIKIKNDHKHPKQQQATLAIKMFVQRIANYIIQYANDLENQVDALVFTAGIGENSSMIRQWIINEIKLLILKIDPIKNENKYDDYLLISNNDSRIPIYKIRTNEEIIICQDTYYLIK